MKATPFDFDSAIKAKARTHPDVCLFEIDEANGALLLRWGGYPYHISLREILAPEDLLWKIHHLGKKAWKDMTAARIAALVEAVAKHKGWPLYSHVPHKNQMPKACVNAAAERARLTPAMRYEVIRRDGHRCRCCGASVSTGAVLHVDHIIPVSKGGVSELSNLQTLCSSCNAGKRDDG